MTNQETVARYFSEMTTNGTCRPIRSAHGSVYSVDDVLYSYGSHFPLVWLEDTQNGKIWIHNDARYSVTTSKHQSLVRSEIARSGLPSMTAKEWHALRPA